jgi:uncharacterized membrane protein HdeD (DUF308 family)
MRAGTTGVRADPADMVARVGRHWGWVLGFGCVTFVLGILALAWPGRTLIVVAVVFGAQLVVMGIFRFVSAFASSDLTGGTRVLLALLGVLSLIIGLYAVRHILVTLLALALFSALSHRGMQGRGWTAFMGILSVVSGVIVLAYPGISLRVLAVVLSIWLLVYGVMLILLAAQIRSPAAVSRDL